MNFSRKFFFSKRGRCVASKILFGTIVILVITGCTEQVSNQQISQSSDFDFVFCNSTINQSLIGGKTWKLDATALGSQWPTLQDSELQKWSKELQRSVNNVDNGYAMITLNYINIRCIEKYPELNQIDPELTKYLKEFSSN